MVGNFWCMDKLQQLQTLYCSLIIDCVLFCPSCGINQESAIAIEKLAMDRNLEVAKLREKNRELAKALNKHNTGDSQCGTCKKAKQEKEFDDDADKDLSLMGDSILSADSYRSETDLIKEQADDGAGATNLINE